MKHTHNYTSFIAISIAALLIILLLHPTTSAFLFPFRRRMMLNSLLNKVEKTNKIDAQEFWKMREFYYPGSITFAKVASENKPHTIFRSSYITSYEYLVPSNTFKEGISVKRNGKVTEIIFIKPISEMKKANGFFDYNDKDKKLLEGKYWFVYTTIST